MSTLDERVRVKMDEIFMRSAKYFETLLRDARAEGLTSAGNLAAASQEMLSYICGVMYQAKLRNDVEIIRRDLKPGLMRFFDRADASVDHPVKSPSKPAKSKELSCV
jgi:TetR/AcrR family transcriptional repressor of nem operon